ncbi:MAG TPA: MBL fold metallo-hydrolase [Bacteroidales bacterium]|nr:MBL fold metallo-hydrolase [Bacteroidales bacterium]HQH40456.1 MBL fold metallo-hydrolase [Bacteroidales bacterium]HQK37000.1 MBL fold metallo-hydrolase [Bacteroidales bacterium]
MKIKIFVFNSFQENTFIMNDASGEAFIIDPGCSNPDEEKQLREYVQDNHLHPLAIVLTHGHIDHILGVPFCTKEWRVPVWMHPADGFLYRQATAYAQVFGLNVSSMPDPDRMLDEGEVLKCGEESLEILHVPGHSPGGIALYNREEQVLLPGDILFNGSIGRSDLPGGDHQLLVDGIRRKLLVLPENTLVWPGHGPSTTIGREKATNPYL